MALDETLFLHDSDQAAMKALKAIPGFSQFSKAYMNIWNERQYRIINMSSNLRINENQMKKYYDMLPPICEKLGIEIPELYLQLDVNPNAYTYGDTNPFIVITSGLFETLPEDLIPTVLAHECGHIACHHTLFTTMGSMILNGSAKATGIASLITVPLQIAFAYWMRCSEYSADRAAIIYDGKPDKMIEVCMRLAGYDKDMKEMANIDAFMDQAKEYREMVADSKWNKTLEFMLFNQMDHPLNAVRAYECREWANSKQFSKVINYIDSMKNSITKARELPVPNSAKYYIGKNYQDIQTSLQEAGFSNIVTTKSIEKGRTTKPGQILDITINDNNSFSKGDWYLSDSSISIIYYEEETAEEAAASHAGKIQIPDSSKKYIGRNYQEVSIELSDAGFTEIITKQQEVKKGLFAKDKSISKITISGQTQFEKGSWFPPESIIRITYNVIPSEPTEE